jgi:hypothetical protein
LHGVVGVGDRTEQAPAVSGPLAAVAFQLFVLEAVVELVYGPLYYRLLLRTRPVDPDLVPAVVELAFSGLRTALAAASAPAASAARGRSG